MNQRTAMNLVLSVCVVLLVVAFVFSIRVTLGINRAATIEATQHSPVRTPPSLAPGKPAPSHA